MDENFAENLGMSSNVDEGLWDRLKSRASSFTQGAKNISGGRMGAVGTTESAKFNSLFRGFVASELSILKSLHSSIQPWLGQATPEQQAQLDQIYALDSALKGIDFGKLPVNEALPTFGNLGARWAGGLSPILDSYKKRLASTYDSFINDVKKLNIVPDQYIQRKIASSNSGAYEALKALEPVIGQSTTGNIPTPPAPAPAPATPAPVVSPAATSPAPAPSAAPTPAASPAPAPAAPVSPPVATSPAPAATPTSVSTPTTPAAQSAATDSTLADYELHNKALESIAKELNKAGNQSFASQISHNIAKLASKAEVVMNPSQKIEVEMNNNIYRMLVRYKYNKDKMRHSFEGALQVYSPDPNTGTRKLTRKDSQWHPIVIFGATDIVNPDGSLKPGFDIYKLVSRSNPELGKIINDAVSRVGKPADYQTLSDSLVKGFVNFFQETASDNIRGIRITQADKDKSTALKAAGRSDDVEPDQELTGTGPNLSPQGPPKKGNDVKINPHPDQRSQSIQPPKDKPPTVTSPKTSPESPAKSVKPVDAKKPTEVPTSPEKPESSKLKDLVPKTGTPAKAKAGKTPKSGINVDGEGNLTFPGSNKPESPLAVLKASLKKDRVNKRDIDDFVQELRVFNATTDQIKRVLQRIAKDIGDEKKAAATPQSAERTTKKPTAKPVADKKAAVAPTATPVKKPAVAPVAPKASPVAKTEEPATAETQPTKPLFGDDKSRIDVVNKNYMIPNKLTPLTTIDQVNKFRAALGVGDPSPEQTKYAHQQATGAIAPPQSGAEKLKARVQPPQKMKEGLTLRDFFSL